MDTISLLTVIAIALLAAYVILTSTNSKELATSLYSTVLGILVRVFVAIK